MRRTGILEYIFPTPQTQGRRAGHRPRQRGSGIGPAHGPGNGGAVSAPLPERPDVICVGTSRKL